MTFRIVLLATISLCVIPLAAQSTPAATPPATRGEAPGASPHSVVEVHQGWRSQPNGRGTVDIIWSCIVTIFLCSWSALCVNVPAEEDSTLHILWRKFCLMLLGLFGPEFILQLALGQFISAWRAKKAFHASGYRQWTLTHSFFADMGGFVLYTPDWVPFPIDALQLHYLVTRGYLTCPKVSKREIKDRNKVDTLLRVITVLQTLWLTLSERLSNCQLVELAAACVERPQR